LLNGKFLAEHSMNFVFEFDDYKSLLARLGKDKSILGKGPLRRIAEKLNVNSTFVSQVINGDKHLSVDHGYSLCGLLGLNSLQTDYVVTLIQKDRCGSIQTKRYFQKKLRELKSEAQKISNYVSEHTQLNPVEQSVFYSDKVYSSARLLTGIEKYEDLEALRQRLNLSKKELTEVVEFLVSAGLCRKTGKRIHPTQQNTHIDKGSKFYKHHHRNWRINALEKDLKNPESLHFTSPLTLARDDIKQVQAELRQAISNVAAVVNESDPDDLFCLNIDFFCV
ncbi:MAG: TIGR02147 family protein, partial [Pseudomonadota bacterium]